MKFDDTSSLDDGSDVSTNDVPVSMPGMHVCTIDQ